jgi:hypothetical protein
MKINQFTEELFARIWKEGPTPFESNFTNVILEEVNAMTGGAFYKSIAKLPDDYEFPT